MSDYFIYTLAFTSAIYCAYRAILAKRILPSTLWLACVSALTALVLYQLGVTQVAVIELSVGAGLVTVLLVYAISVVGDDAFDPTSIIPKPLALGLTLAGLIFLGLLILPLNPAELDAAGLDTATSEAAASGLTAPLSKVLWQQRILDVWVQMVLIFSGVMGMLGLLAEGKTKPRSGLDTLHQVQGRNLVGSAAIRTGTDPDANSIEQESTP